MADRTCNNCTFSRRTVSCLKDKDTKAENCDGWSERVFTNADAIRQMTDEEMIVEISRLQDIAAACPSCHQKHGVERLRLYLTARARTE